MDKEPLMSYSPTSESPKFLPKSFFKLQQRRIDADRRHYLAVWSIQRVTINIFQLLSTFYIRENRSHVDKYAYYLQHFRMGNGLTDFCLTAHIWLKHLWNVDASIFVQVVL